MKKSFIRIRAIARKEYLHIIYDVRTLGIVIMLPLAALSWHLIEKPALGLKRRAVRAA